MRFNDNQNQISRREFLRGLSGGALALAAAPLLGGCYGGGTTPFPRPMETFRLFVSTFLGGTVETFNAGTGASMGTFANLNTPATPGQPPFAEPNGGNTTAGLVVGPGGDLFVFSPGGNIVAQYDLATGALKGTIRSLITPHTGAIGPDGSLYVDNAPTLNNNGSIGFGPDTIQRFDSRTGAPIGRFAAATSPFGLVWGPDDNLYVSTALEYVSPVVPIFTPKTDFVTRLDGKTGASLGVVVRDVKIPFSLAFAPDGGLLVPEHFESRIQHYNLETGAVNTFAQVPFPVGIMYGPDTDLYVASFAEQDPFTTNFAPGTGSIRRFDGRTGQPKGTLVSGLPYAGYLTFA